MKNIVVIGGGHGQSTILRGVKNLPDANVTAIVTVADDGGSTGRIREYYNIPAMGDIRNCLIALSDESVLTNLLDYRFIGPNEVDIIGHNLGNLILTAAADLTDSFESGIDFIADIIGAKGSVIPVSTDVITLFAKMEDETIVKGEKNIPSFNQHIESVFYDHPVSANPKAVEAIMNADIVVLGIGSLYTSILPIVIIDDIKKALETTKAKKVYFANSMTQSNETYGYDLKDHVDALKKHGANVDLIVKHNNPIPNNILDRYAATNSIEVVYNNNLTEKVIETDLLDFSKGLVRHSSEKIAKVIKELL